MRLGKFLTGKNVPGKIPHWENSSLGKIRLGKFRPPYSTLVWSFPLHFSLHFLCIFLCIFLFIFFSFSFAFSFHFPLHFLRTLEEKEAWLAALFCAIEETYRRKSSLKLSQPVDPHEELGTACTGAPPLGSVPPLLVAMDTVSKCMKCSVQFSMVRRKNHCRACGNVSWEAFLL